MVRRMLVRATTKNYNQVVAELVALVRKSAAATPLVMKLRSISLAKLAEADTGRTMPNSKRRLGHCRLIVVLVGDAYGWCSRLLKITRGAGSMERRH